MLQAVSVTQHLITATGTISVKADAYGTLKTPAGTFNNVLRLSIRQAITDTFTGLYSAQYIFQTYDWYADGISNTLLSISFDTITTLGTSTPGSSTNYATNISAGISNISPSISFNTYPNPATDKIFINTVAPVKRVMVTNMLGQNVIDMQPEHVAANNPVEISVAELPVGIYSCTITTPSGSVSRRIVKE